MTDAGAIENVASWCEQQWLVQSAQYTDRDIPDYKGLLQSWLQYGDKCRGTSAYEARLAFIYFYLDEPIKAKETLKPVLNKESEYNYLVQLAQLLAEAKEVVLVPKRDSSRLQELDNRFLKFVKQYPERMEGYALLGAIESELNRDDIAIQLFEMALVRANGAQQQWGIYRNLTISYAQVGRYQDAYNAAGTAISLTKGVMSDPYFVYSVAKADAGLGRFADAQTALRVIAAKRPEVKQDKDFLAAVDFVFDKMNASKSQK